MSFDRLPLATALFAGIALLISIDLLIDFRQGGNVIHLTIEFVALLVAGLGVALLWQRWQATHADLEAVRQAAEEWRAESEALIRGLSEAIEKQFRRWALTPAEAEVALMLLKGLSLKEIAQLRQTSERTIREQARSVYRKSGLSGRAALSAFFLEDLLLPHQN